jgi:hypothetical protein
MIDENRFDKAIQKANRVWELIKETERRTKRNENAEIFLLMLIIKRKLGRSTLFHSRKSRSQCQ